MNAFAALLLAAAAPVPADALPREVTALGGAQVTIVRAERVSAVAESGAPQHDVRREGRGLVVHFN